MNRIDRTETSAERLDHNTHTKAYAVLRGLIEALSLNTIVVVLWPELPNKARSRTDDLR
jgi:hypothetical protein